jgi:hypothetical protein
MVAVDCPKAIEPPVRVRKIAIVRNVFCMGMASNERDNQSAVKGGRQVKRGSCKNDSRTSRCVEAVRSARGTISAK